MSKQRPTEVLGALPRTRPHRRSEKRAPAPAGSAPARSASTPAAATPRRTQPGSADQPPGGTLGTAVQVAAELAEIGLAISARAVRGALSRLPRP
ncbi:MAG: hypothetical protein JO206_03475 [Solirubrobacterales bacterium]|nr:hypothetical protein [Solirubrobacterales bacterium]MBV9472004.1 hypothetical protein [Solirubrobacterales bacterium]